jgi:hypothetical protein
MRRALHFIAVLLAAAVMGLELAHVLEWGPKAGYPAGLYVRLQESLYVWFGNIGAVLYLLAIVSSVVLAVLVRRDGQVRWLASAAAAAQIVALIVFFAVIYPVNQRFPVHGPGAVPADWAALRDRWEAGHAAGFILYLAALVLLLIAAMRSRSSSEPARRLPTAVSKAHQHQRG